MRNRWGTSVSVPELMAEPGKRLVQWNKGGRWQANDEGYYWQYCGVCGQETEWENDDCLKCFDRRK